LYERARKWLEASHCYERVDNFGRAVKILDKEELYDQAIDCLQRYNIRRQVSIQPEIQHPQTGKHTARNTTSVDR
jgi:hypothetical protein